MQLTNRACLPCYVWCVHPLPFPSGHELGAHSTVYTGLVVVVQGAGSLWMLRSTIERVDRRQGCAGLYLKKTRAVLVESSVQHMQQG